MATQDEYIKTALRLPRHLHADLLVTAQNAGRSMNAEIIERLGKSADLAHLHRVIEQLSQTMQSEREGASNYIASILQIFETSVQALDEALLLAQQGSAKPSDIQRLRDEIRQARTALEIFSALNRKTTTGSQLPILR